MCVSRALPETPGQRIFDLYSGRHIPQKESGAEGAGQGQGLVTGMSAAQEPKPESYSIDDVTALAAEQIKKILPPDNETSEQFQQLVKKMLKQAGK